MRKRRGEELDLLYHQDTPGTTPDAAISVHALTSAARDLLEGAILPVWIRGEITDFKRHKSGHCYFVLRDSQAQVRCVIWASQLERISVTPEDGMQIVAMGQLTVWPARGDMQFTVRQIKEEGEGAWSAALEKVRKKLELEGLLDPKRKRKLPEFPNRIAVITSTDGAALHDVIRVARSRSPQVEIVVISARVQGEGAAASLCDAVSQFNRWGDADVVVIGRGGGSREDLRAFDDEQLARAVASCVKPIVSAVGHETDVTLCDLVADVRASTPSAAAEIAVPSRKDTEAKVRSLATRLGNAALRRSAVAATSIDNVKALLVKAAMRATERRHARMVALSGRLQALSPLSTLARGYAVARSKEGKTLVRTTHFDVATDFELWMQDGKVLSTVKSVEPHESLASEGEVTS